MARILLFLTMISKITTHRAINLKNQHGTKISTHRVINLKNQHGIVTNCKQKHSGTPCSCKLVLTNMDVYQEVIHHIDKETHKKVGRK